MKVDGILARARRYAALAVVVVIAAGAAGDTGAQQLDICGCANAQSLGAFDTSDPATWPPGLVVEQSFRRVVLGLPEDGVLVFDSVMIKPRPGETFQTVFFRPNARNTPVTLLVKGDFTLASGVDINISGQNSGGENSKFGGLGGPGGFRGGDGAYPLVDLIMSGGAGLGPAGGAPGTVSPLVAGRGGGFIGNLELLPMIGGSGGGGGSANSTVSTCIAGGGGGGGGAILISANGTVNLTAAGSQIAADGGVSGRNTSTCFSGGGPGAGGAIRIVAARITGPGQLLARQGNTTAQNGRIRLEAIVNDLAVANTTPTASRSLVPGPPAPPILPTVRITRVGGTDAPLNPTGNTGAIDITLPAPGNVEIQFATTGVPSGTTVDVFVKPRLGGGQTVLPVTLTACIADGSCAESVLTNLAAGTYTIEARATFQAP